MEQYKDIKNFEEIYQVSNLGNVRRWRKKRKVWFYLKPLNHSGGYRRLKLRNKGNDVDVYIHRLVAFAFLGESDLVVNHKDGDKTNNKLTNLEYCTTRENVVHAQLNFNRGVRKTKFNRYTSRIMIEGKRIFLGSFGCETAAKFAYIKAMKDNGITNKYL